MLKFIFIPVFSSILLVFASIVSADIYKDQEGNYNLVSQSGNRVTISQSGSVSFNGRQIVSCPSDYEVTKLFEGGVVTCDGQDITVTAGSAVFNFDGEDAQIVDAGRIENKEISEIQSRNVGSDVAGDGIVINDGNDRVEINRKPANLSINNQGQDSVVIDSASGSISVLDADGGLVNIKSNDLVVATKNDDLVVDLKNDLLFDFNSAAVKDEARLLLNQLANLIANKRQGYVAITGHSDSIGEKAYNQELSEKRAGAVAAWLSSNANLAFSDMIIQGLGEDYPVAANVNELGEDYPDGRAKNRRVEIVIQTVKKDPTYLRSPRATILDTVQLAREGAIIGAEGARIGVAGAITGLQGLAEGLDAASEGLNEARQQLGE